MFYRIKDNKIYDYADYEYASDCLSTNLCTMQSFQKNADIYEIIDGEIALASNYKEILAQKKQKQFELEFFHTSLGWIRRQVSMQDGSTKDFLTDLLLPIKAGMELGKLTQIITYKTPDFTQELTPEYMQSLQQFMCVNESFIEECLLRTAQDFGASSVLNIGNNIGGSNGV